MVPEFLLSCWFGRWESLFSALVFLEPCGLPVSRVAHSSGVLAGERVSRKLWNVSYAPAKLRRSGGTPAWQAASWRNDTKRL